MRLVFDLTGLHKERKGAELFLCWVLNEATLIAGKTWVRSGAGMQ